MGPLRTCHMRCPAHQTRRQPSPATPNTLPVTPARRMTSSWAPSWLQAASAQCTGKQGQAEARQMLACLQSVWTRGHRTFKEHGPLEDTGDKDVRPSVVCRGTLTMADGKDVPVIVKKVSASEDTVCLRKGMRSGAGRTEGHAASGCPPRQGAGRPQGRRPWPGPGCVYRQR